MLEIIVYHKETNKIILALPLMFDKDTCIKQLDALLHDCYDYRIYCGMKPVCYRDDDGDICLKPNSFVINSEMLK